MQDEELTPGMSFSPAKSIRKARSPWCCPAPDKKLELRSWELPSSPFLALTTFCSSRLTWDFLPQPCLEEPEACVAKLRIKKQIGTLLTFTTDAVTPPRNELTPYTPLAQLGLEGRAELQEIKGVDQSSRSHRGCPEWPVTSATSPTQQVLKLLTSDSHWDTAYQTPKPSSYFIWEPSTSPISPCPCV